MIANPYEVIDAKLEQIAADVRTLKSRLKDQPVAEERGGVEFAAKVANRTKSTIYKYVHDRSSGFPYTKVNGRLFFRRSEIERWMDGIRVTDPKK